MVLNVERKIKKDDFFNIAIVGGGPNCTYALERLAFVFTKTPPDLHVNIHVFEKSGRFGDGLVHDASQPESNQLNRIVGQISFAPDESYLEHDRLRPASDRINLIDWVKRKYGETGKNIYKLEAESWPARKVHGEALAEHFTKYVAELDACRNVSISIHENEISGLDEVDGRYRLNAIKPLPYDVVVDHLLLVTGHSHNSPVADSMEERFARKAAGSKFAYYSTPYPVVQIKENETGPDKEVGCWGLGQSAIDVILQMTQMRGGKFEKKTDSDELRYIPSGREPKKIFGISRSGLLPCSRPFNAKEQDIASYEHEGVYFTTDAIDRLRLLYGKIVEIEGYGERRQLDFDRHVFPLVHLEMELVYYNVLFGADFASKFRRVADPLYIKYLAGQQKPGSDEASIAFFQNETRRIVDEAFECIEKCRSSRSMPESQEERAAVKSFVRFLYGEEDIAAFFELKPSPFMHSTEVENHRFSWKNMTEPMHSRNFNNGDEFRSATLEFMRYDRLQSKQNNRCNPMKATTDGIWRDLRPVFSYLIDFGGLTAASHKRFLSEYMRHHNRLADGGGIEQLDKIQALIEADVLDLAVAPGPEFRFDDDENKMTLHCARTNERRTIDTLINSRLCSFDLRRDVSALYQKMYKKGILKPWVNPSDSGEDFIPGGPLLTREYFPIGQDGVVNRKISILGPPSEGAMFFQLTLARPNKKHQVLEEIIAWTERLLSQLRQQEKHC